MISNPKWVSKTPFVTVLLLESANVAQIARMVTQGSSGDQSVAGWIMVNLALLLWLNFYRVCMPPGPGRRWAIGATAAGVIINGAVILTVLFFRLIGAS